MMTEKKTQPTDANLINVFGQMRPPTVDPTPEEIRERCAEIQKEWSRREEKRRRGVDPDGVVELQAMKSRGDGKGDPAAKGD